MPSCPGACNTTTAIQPARCKPRRESKSQPCVFVLFSNHSNRREVISFLLWAPPTADTFRNHQHRAGERELSPLHRASSAGAKQTRGVWCAAGCSVTFVSAHTSTTQLLSATRRSTASSELFLTCLLTNSFLLLKDTARCLTWHQSYAPRRPSHKEGRQKWCYLPEWKSGFGQDLGLRTLASPDPRRTAYWGVPNKLQHSLFPFLISETKIAFAYFIIVRYRSLSKCSQQQTFKEKPCSEHLCYQIKRRSHSNAAMHSPIPQSRSASMSFQVWDHSTGL